MRGSTKTWIKWLRVVQLVLRILELVGALGLLVIMILLRGMEASTGWIMRVAVSLLVSFNNDILMIVPAWSRSLTYCIRCLPPLTKSVWTNARLFCLIHVVRFVL